MTRSRARSAGPGHGSEGSLPPVIIETQTLIIGAGPAGLAVAGRLRRLGVGFEMVEAAEQVADSWHGHYDRLHLHTVKDLSHLPHVPFPSSYPRYVPRRMLVDYYSRYAETFRIEPRFGTRVRSIERDGERWLVSTESGESFRATHVVVATGVNRVPYRPLLEGEEDFEGWVIHSRDYRNPTPYLGHRVLVVGMGNTGAEIALDLSEQDVAVAISVRSPVNIVPRDVFGRPSQLTAMLAARLPERLGDLLGVIVRRLTVGDLSAYGIETPELPPVAQLRVYGRTPVMDVGTVAAIEAGRIVVRPGIDHLTATGVAFDDGTEEAFDDIILATGYRPQIEDLIGDCQGLLDSNGVPSHVVGEGRHRGLYFVGFDNYRPGGILGSILEQSAVVAEAISGAAIPGG